MVALPESVVLHDHISDESALMPLPADLASAAAVVGHRPRLRGSRLQTDGGHQGGLSLHIQDPAKDELLLRSVGGVGTATSECQTGFACVGGHGGGGPHRGARVASLHDEAIGALDLHVVVEAAVHQVDEVAARYGCVEAIDHNLQVAALHSVLAHLLQLDLHVHCRAPLGTYTKPPLPTDNTPVTAPYACQSAKTSASGLCPDSCRHKSVQAPNDLQQALD